MKKKMLVGFLVMCLSLMAFALIGCGDKSDSSSQSSSSQSTTEQTQTPDPTPTPPPEPVVPDYVGKYIIVSMEMKDGKVEGDLLDQALASLGGAKENYVDIIDDKTLTIKMGGITTPTTTYKKTGNTFTIDSGGETFELLLSGDTITIVFTDEMLGEGNGYTAVFKKQ